jgi:uncharacterized membrane protein
MFTFRLPHSHNMVFLKCHLIVGVDCERTTDYRSRISCLKLTSLIALFVFLLCRQGVVRSQSTLQRQL